MRDTITAENPRSPSDTIRTGPHFCEKLTVSAGVNSQRMSGLAYRQPLAVSFAENKAYRVTVTAGIGCIEISDTV